MSFARPLVQCSRDFEKSDRPIDFLGNNIRFFSGKTIDKLENLIDTKDLRAVKGNWEIKYAPKDICCMTYTEFEKIFDNVLSTGNYSAYALLRSDERIIGVLKFREYAYCLHFENMIDEKNRLISYKGLVSFPRFDRDFRNQVYTSVNRDVIGIINIKEGLNLSPVVIIHEKQEYGLGSKYFTIENITEKIESFKSRAEELMKQREVKVFDYDRRNYKDPKINSITSDSGYMIPQYPIN